MEVKFYANKAILDDEGNVLENSVFMIFQENLVETSLGHFVSTL